MADDKSVETSEVAQQTEPTNQDKSWEERRLSEVSAAKNKAQDEKKAALADLQRQQLYTAQLEQQLQNLKEPSEPAVTDESAEWVQKYMGPELAKQKQDIQQLLATTLGPMKDRIEKEEFWNGRDTTLQEPVEDAVRQLQLANPNTDINRQDVYYFVRGQQAEEQESVNQQTVTSNAQAVAQANKTAAVAEGSTPAPAEEQAFDDLSAEEQFQKLSNAGTIGNLKKVLGS